MSAAAILRLRVCPSRDEVHRCLGYPPAGPPPGRAAERLDELWEEAVALIAPAGAWRAVDRDAAAAAGMPVPADQVAVALCTIGPALEAESRRRAEAGAVLDALLLDAVGSAAAEAAADALNLAVCAAARRQGLEAAPRESPGYGAWPVSCQPGLLALLPAGALGISLTPGAMMAPRKSVSFAAALLPHAVADPGRCERCGMTSCRHRHDGAR